MSGKCSPDMVFRWQKYGKQIATQLQTHFSSIFATGLRKKCMIRDVLFCEIQQASETQAYLDLVQNVLISLIADGIRDVACIGSAW